jgi:hypothetical protein
VSESFREKVLKLNDKHFVNPQRLPKWMAKSALRIFLCGLLFLGIVVFFIVKIIQNQQDWTSFLSLLVMLYFLLIGFSALYASYRVKNQT